MKITAFNASPWGQDGHTNIITRQFLNGALIEGAKVNSINLIQNKILPCDKCGACFYKTPGKCIIKDDMNRLISKFMASDVALFAAPLYIDNVAALMKLFIDRLTPILEPHYEKDPSGQFRRAKRFKKYPEFFAISSCEMPDQSSFQVLRIFFRRMARSLHTSLVGEIYRSCAGLLLISRNDLKFRPAVNQYLNLLYQTGREFAKTKKISQSTAEKLEQSIVDADEYVEYANKTWDHILPKHKLIVFA